MLASTTLIARATAHDDPAWQYPRPAPGACAESHFKANEPGTLHAATMVYSRSLAKDADLPYQSLINLYL